MNNAIICSPSIRQVWQFKDKVVVDTTDAIWYAPKTISLSNGEEVSTLLYVLKRRLDCPSFIIPIL